MLASPPLQAERNTTKKAEQQVDRSQVFLLLLAPLFKLPVETTTSANMAENVFLLAHQTFCSIQFSHCCAMPAVPMHLVNCSFLTMVLFQCSAPVGGKLSLVEVEDKNHTQLAKSPLWLRTMKEIQQELHLLPPAENQCHHRCKQHLVSYLFNNPNIDCCVFDSVISSKQTSKSGLCRVILCVFHLCLFGPSDLNTLVTLPSMNYC